MNEFNGGPKETVTDSLQVEVAEQAELSGKGM